LSFQCSEGFAYPSPTVPRQKRQSDGIEEGIMTRKYIDCREFPSEMNCTVSLAADTEKELIEAAVQHAVTVHHHTDSPELRSQLMTLFHDGTPPLAPPRVK
jgi:predicted small metal-binding protein